MSRTLRRKSKKSDFEKDWISFSEWSRNYYRKRYPNCSDEEIIHRKSVKYHADNHSGEWSVPSYYGRYLNKKIKYRNKLTLLRSIRTDIEYEPIPHKKDSGWSYW
jgi:hypothetical protein